LLAATGNVISYDTLDQLLTTANPTSVSTELSFKGRNAVNDGGGGTGIFVQDSSPTNLGTVFNSKHPNGSGWQFKRKYDGKLNVNWFGAKGTGTDETIAIASAFANAANRELYFPAGDYVISSQILVTNNVSVIGAGRDSTFITSTNSSGKFQFSGYQQLGTSTTTLVLPARQNTDQISVSDATGFQVGDLLRIESDKLWFWDNRGSSYVGQVSEITGISGNTLRISPAMQYTYDNPSGMTNVNVICVNPIKVSISDMSFRHNVYKDISRSSLLGFGNAKDSTVNRVDVFNGTQSGSGVGASLRVIYDDFYAYGACNATTGYGIQINNGTECKVLNSRFDNCRRGVDYSGTYPSIFGGVYNSECFGSGTMTDGTEATASASGFGTHGPASAIEFVNNEVGNVNVGFIIRGDRCKIQGNRFSGRLSTCITLTYAPSLYVMNNVAETAVIANALSPGGTSIYNYTIGYFLTVSTLDSNKIEGLIDIRDNSVECKNFLRWTDTQDTPSVLIKNNHVVLRSNSGSSTIAFIDNFGNPLWRRLLVSDNEIAAFTGIYKFWSVAPNLSSTCVINNHASVINIKDYGALGTGIDDDTAAWNAAITAAAGTTMVVLPSGSYLVNGTNIQGNSVTNAWVNLATGTPIAQQQQTVAFRSYEFDLPTIQAHTELAFDVLDPQAEAGQWFRAFHPEWPYLSIVGSCTSDGIVHIKLFNSNGIIINPMVETFIVMYGKTP